MKNVIMALYYRDMTTLKFTLAVLFKSLRH